MISWRHQGHCRRAAGQQTMAMSASTQGCVVLHKSEQGQRSMNHGASSCCIQSYVIRGKTSTKQHAARQSKPALRALPCLLIFNLAHLLPTSQTPAPAPCSSCTHQVVAFLDALVAAHAQVQVVTGKQAHTPGAHHAHNAQRILRAGGVSGGPRRLGAGLDRSHLILPCLLRPLHRLLLRSLLPCCGQCSSGCGRSRHSDSRSARSPRLSCCRHTSPTAAGTQGRGRARRW